MDGVAAATGSAHIAEAAQSLFSVHQITASPGWPQPPGSQSNDYPRSSPAETAVRSSTTTPAPPRSVAGGLPTSNSLGREEFAGHALLDGSRPPVTQAPPPPPPATAAGGPQAAVMGKPALRKGKWTVEEETYTACIINNFNKGYLSINPGTTLRSYLSERLNCDPMRITKKFAGAACIGKQVFHPCDRTPDVLAAMQRAQKRLSELEQVFLSKLQQQQKPSRKSAAAAAAAAAAAHAQGVQSAQGVGGPGALSGGPGLGQSSKAAAYLHFNAHAPRTNPNMYVKTSDDDQLMHSRAVPTGDLPPSLAHQPRPSHPHDVAKAVQGLGYGAAHAGPFLNPQNPQLHAALSHAPPLPSLVPTHVSPRGQLPHPQQPYHRLAHHQHASSLEYTEDDRNAGGLLLDFFASVQLRASANTLSAPRVDSSVVRSQPAGAMDWEPLMAPAPAPAARPSLPLGTAPAPGPVPSAVAKATAAPAPAPAVVDRLAARASNNSSPTNSSCSSTSSAAAEPERLPAPSSPRSRSAGNCEDMDTTGAPTAQRHSAATTPSTSPGGSPPSARKRSMSDDAGSAAGAARLPGHLQLDSMFTQGGAPPVPSSDDMATRPAPPLKKPRSFGSLEGLA